MPPKKKKKRTLIIVRQIRGGGGGTAGTRRRRPRKIHSPTFCAERKAKQAKEARRAVVGRSEGDAETRGAHGGRQGGNPDTRASSPTSLKEPGAVQEGPGGRGKVGVLGETPPLCPAPHSIAARGRSRFAAGRAPRPEAHVEKRLELLSSAESLFRFSVPGCRRFEPEETFFFFHGREAGSPRGDMPGGVESERSPRRRRLLGSARLGPARPGLGGSAGQVAVPPLSLAPRRRPAAEGLTGTAVAGGRRPTSKVSGTPLPRPSEVPPVSATRTGLAHLGSPRGRRGSGYLPGDRPPGPAPPRLQTAQSRDGDFLGGPSRALAGLRHPSAARPSPAQLRGCLRAQTARRYK